MRESTLSGWRFATATRQPSPGPRQANGRPSKRSFGPRLGTPTHSSACSPNPIPMSPVRPHALLVPGGRGGCHPGGHARPVPQRWNPALPGGAGSMDVHDRPSRVPAPRSPLSAKHRRRRRDRAADCRRSAIVRLRVVQLVNAISTLPLDMRLVFIMRDVRGFSGAETTSVLGISTAAMKTRLHRARAYVREAIGSTP